MAGTQRRARDDAHQREVTQRRAEADGGRPEQQAEAHADRRREDPSQRTETASTDQPLTAADDDAGGRAAEQRRDRAVDAVDREQPSHARHREGQEADGPQQPRTR